MIAALLITLREGLEAALIVGIVLGVLRKLGHTNRNKPMWIGVAAAVAVSIVAGLALNALGVAFEGRGEEIFESAAMLLAAGVLTWMIFWMQRQGRSVQAELESDMRQAVTVGSAWALFSLAFVAVLREGIETVLFLTAAAFSATPAETLIGGALGLTDLDTHDQAWMREEMTDRWLGFDRDDVRDWYTAAGLGDANVTCAEGNCCTSTPNGASVALGIFVACGVKAQNS